MRLFLVLTTLIIPSFFSFAQEVSMQKVQAPIADVTVFITGGEVHRTAETRIKSGRNKLVFTGISTVADNKSIQFSSDSKLNLVSVSSQIDYLSNATNNPRITSLKDSIELLSNEVVDLNNEKMAYSSEKQLLDQNRSIKGEQQNLSVEELRSMATYYRERMMAINKKMTEYDVKISKKNELQTRYKRQLAELNFQETVKSNQIVVIVDSPSEQTVNLDLKYIVSNCGWQANYDLLAENIQNKIKLKYKAKVYNNTGNDWKNISLFLSTADPNLSASAPNLTPWYLNYSSFAGATNDYEQQSGYVVPQNRQYKQYYQNMSTPQMNQNLDGVGFGGGVGIGGNGSGTAPNISFSQIEVSQLSTTFDIDKNYTIPSDSKPYLVDITEHDLSASFSHKAVPKIDKDVFLLANIVGWESLDLVPGPTQVYFSDAFVGQSFINTSNVQDTLRLSFGRDLKIPVSRKLVKEFSDKKVVGSNRKDTYTYKIVAKNNREIPVKVSLFDQIPISQDSDISVTVNEINDATYNELTGLLKWNLTLNPGESKTYQISFTIKYPKEQVIRMKKYRTISAPSF